MATRKELLGNELMKEIISIRIDSLWNMLALRRQGRLPPVDAEKATGDFDDKGALFIPGGFVFQDWEEQPIRRRSFRDRGPEGFRKLIRRVMRHDGAHLLYQDGIAARVKLSNTAFARLASNILENKREALRRRTALGDKRPAKLGSANITRSYCPTYIPAPYGTRTSLSSDVSVCITEPRMYYRLCEDYFSLRSGEADDIWNGIRESGQPIEGDGCVLAPPFLITCHSTRHREEILTGVTRLSGFGKFGEFATFTLELATTELIHELEGGRSQYSDDEIVADFDGIQVVAVLRTYPRTNPGARLKKGVVAALIAPEKELGIDVAKIGLDARRRYHVD